MVFFSYGSADFMLLGHQFTLKDLGTKQLLDLNEKPNCNLMVTSEAGHMLIGR